MFPTFPSAGWATFGILAGAALALALPSEGLALGADWSLRWIVQPFAEAVKYGLSCL